MNFIKKIFEGSIDEDVHLQFQKFSKGEFRNRAIIQAKQSKGKFTINASAEFANGLVKSVAKELGENRTKVNGAVVSTSNLQGKLNFKEIKQFQGVKRYLIDNEMSGKEIGKLLDEFPRAFFALSFDSPRSKLKIKAKSPKSGKPGKEDENPKADFCKLITENSELGKSFVPEKPGFQKAEINHTYIIQELILPKGENDFAKIRELAKRKGKIVRKAVIDGQKIESEKEFEA